MRLWSLPALGWHSGSAMAANALKSPGRGLLFLETEAARVLTSQGFLGGANEAMLGKHLAADRKHQ